MFGIRGDFTGFTYNGVHSSMVGLTHVSSSNRYSDNLLPTFKDRVVDNASGNGKYFFGTDYTQRELSVSVAFDGVEEHQQQVMRMKWADGEIHDLIFDEEPYKIYSAKLTNNSTLKHLCFDGETSERLYKGEGTLNFICLFPYARSRYEYQEDYVASLVPEWGKDITELARAAGLTEDARLIRATIYYDAIDDESTSLNATMTSDTLPDWPVVDLVAQEASIALDETDNAGFEYGIEDSYYNNLVDWAVSSGIPSGIDYGRFDSTSGTYKIYNAGDVEVPFQIWFIAASTSAFSISIDGIGNLSAAGLKPMEGDYYFVFDAGAHTIEGYDSAGKQTGHLYNYCITDGDFFMLPLGESTIKINEATPHDIKFHYWYY